MHPQDLHHQDWSHPGTPPIVFQVQSPNPNFSLAASCSALPRWFIRGSTTVSLFSPFTGFTVISRLQNFKGEILYIYLKWGTGPVTAEQLWQPGATCEQELSPWWWAWHSQAGFQGFLGGDSEVSCEALASAFLLSQVIPFEWRFGARCYFWEVRLLKIPHLCCWVCGGIKLISLCWGTQWWGRVAYLGVSISQTVVLLREIW